VAEVPEALFGLANALFWLGDLAGTIANCEKAYAGFRRRGDPMFAAGAALSLVGYNKGYLGNTAAARGWLSRAARIIENEAPELRGELLGATAYVTEDPVESEALARQAAEIGRANGHSDLELMAMHAVGQARFSSRRSRCRRASSRHRTRSRPARWPNSGSRREGSRTRPGCCAASRGAPRPPRRSHRVLRAP